VLDRIQVNPGTLLYDLSFSKYNDVAWPAVIGSTSVEISLLASWSAFQH
jgi:hypothetical protein